MNSNMNIETLKIIQHSVIKLTFNRRQELANKYAEIGPDIILYNSTGLKDEERFKLFTYNTYQKNRSGEDDAGIAIAIRKNIPHRIEDTYEEDMLGVTIRTVHGPVTVATTYIPPRMGYIYGNDFNKLFQLRRPAYLIGNLNATHTCLGHEHDNLIGKGLYKLQLQNDKAFHLGPHFSTMVSGRGNPDMVLANRAAQMNYSILAGGITSSDHLPIIITLSTKPIIISPKTMRAIKKADREGLKKQATEGCEADDTLTLFTKGQDNLTTTEIENKE